MGKYGTYVVVVLLHGDDPRHVVERDGAEPEVRVVGDLVDFPDEAVEVRRLDAVDSRDEVGRREAVLVGWRTATLLSN